MTSTSPRHVAFLALLSSTACTRTPASAPAPAVDASPSSVTISVVGTNDLHGRLRALPILAGYVRVLRDVHAVLLVDGGDMFQGTIESNGSEGAAVVAAYALLGYDAVTIGNHEFDYGPVGERVTPRGPEDDPTGALEARAAEAKFPFLAANLVESATGKTPPWPNVVPSVVRDVGGVKVGVVGVTTMSTLHTTIPVNVKALAVTPLAEAITREAKALRAAGAAVVVVAAHAGGSCEEVEKPTDLASCNADAELFEVARALEPGLVDVIVGGHTHAAVAHEVNGIAIIEALSYGRAFGRVDVTVAGGRVTGRKIHPPKNICAFWDRDLPELERWSSCQPSTYEGKDVTVDAAVAALIAPHLEKARAAHAEKLGVTLPGELRRTYDKESPVGNLFVDLMLEARKGDVALTNGGGLRADLPKGDLTYGRLYEAFPFDNVFATMTLTGAQLREVVRANLGKSSGILSLGGLRAVATCRGPELVVELRRPDGRIIRDTEKLVVITTDFLATGGDGSFSHLELPEDQIAIDQTTTVRDGMAAVLRRGKRASIPESAVYDADHPRFVYPGKRPVKCQ